jgi:hypothetical protein
MEIPRDGHVGVQRVVQVVADVGQRRFPLAARGEQAGRHRHPLGTRREPQAQDACHLPVPARDGQPGRTRRDRR